MEKQFFVKNCSKIKLVIGNGFDLHCALETSYEKYLEHRKDSYDSIVNWVDSFSSPLGYLHSDTKNEFEHHWHYLDSFDHFNVWDFFFAIFSRKISKSSNIFWCEIESEIEHSLTEDGLNGFNWPSIYSLINLRTYENNQFLLVLACAVLKKHNEKRFLNEKDFYAFLLLELKEFEQDFGKYIFDVHLGIDKENIEKAKKDYYLSLASKTLDQLCDLDDVVSIDSFNYGPVPFLSEILHHINGDFNSPIFGIDSSSFTTGDPRFIFSKTSRRLENDMDSNCLINKNLFDSIIIYGHSLNGADYNYYFAIFDQINICDLTNNSVIVFAFSIYSGRSEHDIKSELLDSVCKLFANYALYKGIKEKHQSRLLDSLTASGKVIFLKID